MKLKLDKYDIAMVNACAEKDEGKPLLENICLRDGELIAVDGFTLAIRKADIKEGAHDGETLLPANIIKTIKSTPERQAELDVNDGSLAISYKDEHGKTVDFNPTLTFKPYTGGQFPDISKFFPKDTTKKAHIAIRVGLLKRLLACLPDEGILRIGITEPDKPLEFECSQIDRPIRGIIMPMHVDWDSFKWHKKEEK